MKRIVFVAALLVPVCVWAQFEGLGIAAPYLQNLCNSAPVGSDTVLFNMDAIPDTTKDSLGNPVGPDTVVAAWVKFSLDNQLTWESLPQQRIGEEFYEETWEGLKMLPGSGTVTCYFAARDKDSSSVSTESPNNSSNMWPPTPSLLTFTCDEPDNDCQIPSRSNLELTDFFVGYSSQYGYVRLENTGGEWPYKAGLLGPWFLYGAVLFNPRPFLQDSDYVYMAGRLDINLGIIRYESGLFRLHVDDPLETLTKIGNISQSISGNRLDIRFPFNTLINDPEFGTYEGLVGVAAATAQVTIDVELEVGDGTQPCRFYQDTHTFPIGVNAEPVLADARVTPGSGEPEDTFHFSVAYRDTNNHLPFIRNLYVGRTPYRIGSADHRYIDGASFSKSISGFPLGWHRFYFEFSDGEHLVVTPLDSFQVVTTGVAEEKPSVPFLYVGNGRVVFASGVEGNVELMLFDAAGRKAWNVNRQTDGSRTEVRLPGGLPTGVYFLKVVGPDTRLQKKVVLVDW